MGRRSQNSSTPAFPLVTLHTVPRWLLRAAQPPSVRAPPPHRTHGEPHALLGGRGTSRIGSPPAQPWEDPSQHVCTNTGFAQLRRELLETSMTLKGTVRDTCGQRAPEGHVRPPAWVWGPGPSLWQPPGGEGLGHVWTRGFSRTVTWAGQSVVHGPTQWQLNSVPQSQSPGFGHVLSWVPARQPPEPSLVGTGWGPNPDLARGTQLSG